MYALVVTDKIALKRFLIHYPEYINGNYRDFPEDLAEEFSLCSSTFTTMNNYSIENANAAALALILDKYNAGIALLKQNGFGNFTKLRTISQGSGVNETFTQKNCQ